MTLEKDLETMMREVKKHLKQESKNNLIAMIQNLLFELHFLKTELAKLKNGEKGA